LARQETERVKKIEFMGGLLKRSSHCIPPPAMAVQPMFPDSILEHGIMWIALLPAPMDDTTNPIVQSHSLIHVPRRRQSQKKSP
jgi:hypothetical protein